MNESNPGFCKTLVICFLLIVNLASCSGPGGGAVGVPANGGGPTAHFWQYLYSYGGEEGGYATYSYVLVGRGEQDTKAVSLYFELIGAIQSSTTASDLIPDEVSRNRFNLFVIPATGDAERATPRPDFELSRLLLTTLSSTSSLSFSQPGPYIITLYEPISFGEEGGTADILYVDLTNLPSAAIPEFVRTYKEQVLSERLEGIEKLESFRLSLLKWTLIAEENIGFARAAYAELKQAFLD